MSSASDARREHEQRLAAAENEDAPLVRARICDGLGFPGIELNKARNAENAGVISTDASRATVCAFALTKN
jgi:acetate kinase